MSKCYDIDHELVAAIKQALGALNNVPVVGGAYDQQHSDTQTAAFLRLKDAFKQSDLSDEEGADDDLDDAGGAHGDLDGVDAMRETVTDIGYDICEDSDQPGKWLWMAPSDSSEISYDSEEDAVEAAWNDAAQQARKIHGLNEIAWTSICLAEKCHLIKQALSEN